jgi:hypothetical protein
LPVGRTIRSPQHDHGGGGGRRSPRLIQS